VVSEAPCFDFLFNVQSAFWYWGEASLLVTASCCGWVAAVAAWGFVWAVAGCVGGSALGGTAPLTLSCDPWGGFDLSINAYKRNCL